MTDIHNGFKTIQCAIYFTEIDTLESRVYRFLLSKLLISHTSNYKTKALMHKKLEELYGASLYSRVESHTNLNVMGLIFTFVNPLIVKDNSLFNEVINLLNDMLFERTWFNEEIFLEEKRLLVEQFENIKDNKRVYANYEFGKLFLAGELNAHAIAGRLEDIKKVKLEDIENYYNSAFKDQDIKIYLNGHIEPYLGDFKNKLKLKEQHKTFEINHSTKEPKTFVHKEEMASMNQAILKLGYISGINRFNELYEAALCFELILGGYPESRLFKEIREKQGLCYDVSSTYDYYRGGIIISSGVAKDKKDYALNEIKKLVEDFKVNEITPDELEHAKTYIKHQIQSSLDHQSYLTKSTFIKQLLNETMTTEKRLDRLKQVSLEDVIKISKSLMLDTSYALYGGQK